MNKLYCYNRWLFEEVCKKNGWDDNHIPENTAFISICGTPACQEFVLQEREFHYFEEQHPEVLNLDFDDISDDLVEIPDCPGAYCHGINIDQAVRAVKFIRDNLGKDFYIHCRAGHSRSQAFVRYILDTYDGIYDFLIRPENPPINYNQFVLSELRMGARLTGEYWRSLFIHNGYTIVQLDQHRGSLGALITTIETKELPGVAIVLGDAGCTIVSDDSIAYTDEFDLFSELENLKS